MWFRKPRHSWYWCAFCALLFASFLYLCACLFLGIVSREPKEKKPKKNTKHDPLEDLFIGS